MPYNSWNNTWTPGYSYSTPYTPYPWNNYQLQPAQIQQQQPQQMQGQQVQQQQVQQMPIQNGGFISVQNLEMARNWPVAPGNSVTFKDESAPYIYTKTMGYNQLEAPRFEKYRLVKEELAEEIVQNVAQNAVQSAATSANDAGMAIVDDLRGQLDVLRQDVDKIKAEMSKASEGVSERSTRGRKKEVESDE